MHEMCGYCAEDKTAADTGPEKHGVRQVRRLMREHLGQTKHHGQEDDDYRHSESEEH